MPDDLDPLSTLYARFDSITKDLARRRVSATRRTAHNRLAGSREIAPGLGQEPAPASDRLVAAAPRAESRQSRVNVLEADVIRTYLPEPIAEDELNHMIDVAIAETGATSMRDMGAVMGRLMPELKGRAEGSIVSARVKERLG